MSWKTDLQVLDLEAGTRLEVTCKHCGHFRYEDVSHLIQQMALSFEYLDEVESQLACKKRGCGKPVRIALKHDAETEGFVGGLA